MHRALPLVAISGIRGKSTVLWLLEGMLREAGRSVGVWSSTGVYVDGVRKPGELGPWSHVLQSTSEGEIDIALQELETPMVTSVGLPERIYPLAAVTTLCGNNEECLVSPEASQGAKAQTIVARAIRPDGILVLNADDHAVLAAAEHTEGEIVPFALHQDNPALNRYLRSGGWGVWVQDGRVCVGSHDLHRELFDVAEAHFALEGALTFQVQNLLCAVALALSMDIPDEAITAGARQFDPDVNRLPGSCNIVRLPHMTVVIDAARQIWTLRSLVRGVKHQPHHRVVAVSGCFTHLPEPQVTEAGRLLGRLGGAVLLHAEEIHRPYVDLMIDGIAQNEIPPLVLSMPSEYDAMLHALRMVGDNGLCLVVTEDVQGAFAAIRKFAQ